MAVTAYASSVITPIDNPGQAAVRDLSIDALPLTIHFYADMVDSEDEFPNKSYQWHVIGADPDHPPVIVGDTTNHLEVTISTWYDVQLFVVATNLTSGASSPGLFSEGTGSAKCTLKVYDPDKGLRKYAAGSPLDPDINDWPEAAADAHSRIDTLALTDINGVTISTADLNKLADGSNMAGKHLHGGTDVPYATAAARGAVQFEEANLSGLVPGKERGILQGFYTGTLPAPSALVPVMAWRVPYPMKVKGMSVQAIDGGTGYHTFAVLMETTAINQERIAIGLAASGAPPVDNLPLSLSDTASETFVDGGYFVEVFYSASDGGDPPSNVMFQVDYVRYPGTLA